MEWQGLLVCALIIVVLRSWWIYLRTPKAPPPSPGLRLDEIRLRISPRAPNPNDFSWDVWIENQPLGAIAWNRTKTGINAMDTHTEGVASSTLMAVGDLLIDCHTARIPGIERYCDGIRAGTGPSAASWDWTSEQQDAGIALLARGGLTPAPEPVEVESPPPAPLPPSPVVVNPVSPSRAYRPTRRTIDLQPFG